MKLLLHLYYAGIFLSLMILTTILIKTDDATAAAAAATMDFSRLVILLVIQLGGSKV